MKSFLLALTFVLWSFCSYADVIKEISITGNKRVARDVVLGNLGLEEGDEYLQGDIDGAVHRLYKTRFFSNIVIQSDQGNVTIKLTENPIVEKIIFNGLKAISEDVISTQISTQEKAFFARGILMSDVKQILASYKQSGIFSIKVEPKVKILDNNKVNVIFDITEGERMKVKNIFITGNKGISKSKIKDAIATKEKKWWKLFSSKSIYDTQRVEFEKENIRRLYMNRGYAYAKVQNLTALFDETENKVDLMVDIYEGDKYTIGEVSIDNQIKLQEGKEFNPKIAMDKGDIFMINDIEQTKANIENELAKQGFFFVDVFYNFTPRGESLDVEYKIQDSKRVYIRNITVEGNQKTDINVILRELSFSAGDALRSSDIAYSKRNLQRLGYFGKVDILQQSVSGYQNTVDIVVKVEESNMGTVELSAAYSDRDSFIGVLGVNHNNVLGRGYQAGVSLQSGEFSEAFSISFTNPRVNNRNLLLGGFYNNSTTDNPNFGQFQQGREVVGLSFGYALSRFANHSISLSFAQDTLTMLDQSIVSSVIQRQQGNFTTNLLSHTISYDRRNNFMLPTKGFNVSFSQGLAGIGGGNIAYIQNNIGASVFFETIPTLSNSFVGSIAFKAGVINGIDGRDVNAKDRFDYGQNEMRGFDLREVGPRIAYLDENDNIVAYDQTGSVKSNQFAYLSLQQTFPNFIPPSFGFSTFLFLDAGIYHRTDDQGIVAESVNTIYAKETVVSSNSIRSTYGLGLTWQSPMGPIGFSIGRIISGETYERGRSFRLSLGLPQIGAF